LIFQFSKQSSKYWNIENFSCSFQLENDKILKKHGKAHSHCIKGFGGDRTISLLPNLQFLTKKQKTRLNNLPLQITKCYLPVIFVLHASIVLINHFPCHIIKYYHTNLQCCTISLKIITHYFILINNILFPYIIISFSLKYRPCTIQYYYFFNLHIIRVNINSLIFFWRNQIWNAINISVLFFTFSVSIFLWTSRCLLFLSKFYE